MSRCLMLASPVYTPIDLSGIVDADDLKPVWSSTGLTEDHHITIIYDKDEVIDQNSILDNVKSSLGSEYEIFMTILKDSHRFKLDELFVVDKFSNDDNDYLILKLNKDNHLYRVLSRLNEYFRTTYDIHMDYDDYNAHVTLAELIPGAGDKYISDPDLKLVLSDSTIEFQDLVFSIDTADDHKVWSITTYHTLDRLFL